MPEDSVTVKSVATWGAQKMAEHKFRQQQVEHLAYHNSAKVIKGWMDETEVSEADYDAAIAESKAY